MEAGELTVAVRFLGKITLKWTALLATLPAGSPSLWLKQGFANVSSSR